MTNCQACGTETLGQDRFCKNCGAPVAASVEDLADTRRFEPSAPAITTGALDQNHSLFTPAPATYPLVQESSPLHTTTSFTKKMLQRKLVWLLALLLVFLFFGTGVTIGREAVRERRARHAEQVREADNIRKARQIKQAEAARRSSDEAIQNAMGFTPAPVSDTEYPDIQGVFVACLLSDDSPAAIAHIQAGDLLIELGDQPVRNPAELAHILSTFKPGSETAVKLIRDEGQIPSRIRLGSSSVAPFLPKIEPRDQGFLGVGDVARRCCVAGTRRWGLEIHRIIDNSPADLAGLQLGDVITEIDKQTIRTPAELARRIHAVKPRTKVRIKFYRGNTEQTLDLTAGHGW